MHHSSLESSHNDESNGDIERNVKNWHFVFCDTAPFDVSLNNSASNDRRKMHHSSLESSHNDESNGG
uniref:Uncharacterized protein n=1 Tax=Rhizophagus irregularis (strain DAOM 181602 / DAOM 197198 / MUCL 43194) TaxID=747089 RepID=U9TY42_RHIID